MRPETIEALRVREISKYDHGYFEKEYWKEDLPGKTGNGGRSYDDPQHAVRFGLIASTLLDAVQFGSLLDVGCGPGYLLRSLSHSNAQLTGVDASQVALDLASIDQMPTLHTTKAEFYRAMCTSLPLPGKSFDVVVCLDVLEHLLFVDIERAISEMTRVCKKDLILSINSDNPYFYHPTILSTDTWRAIFDSHEDLLIDHKMEQAFTTGVTAHRDEYTFYCYSVST